MTENTKTKKPSGSMLNRLFVSAFIINMVLQMTNQMMNTLLSKYADALGATTTIIGLISSMFAITALIFKMVSAPAIDTFNRKYVLGGSMLILFASMATYAASSTIQTVMIARLLQGISQAFTTTCCMTIASDSLPKEKLGMGIGYFTLGSTICGAFAPGLGLKLEAAIGYNLTFAILAVLILATALFTLTLKVDHQEGKKFTFSIRSVIAKEAVVPAILLFLLTIANSCCTAFIVLFAIERGCGDNIGYFFTVSAIAMFVARPLIGKLSDRYGAVKVIIPCIFFFAISFVLISYSTNIYMFLLAALINSFGYSGCQPTIQAICFKLVPQERRGAASCTSYIGNDIGNLCGGTVSGYVASIFGYAIMWRVMVIPMAIAALLTVAFRRRLSA